MVYLFSEDTLVGPFVDGAAALSHWPLYGRESVVSVDEAEVLVLEGAVLVSPKDDRDTALLNGEQQLHGELVG